MPDTVGKESAARPALIDLVHEPDFDLGGVSVSPSSRELGVGRGAVMLQPRIMQVLIALARRRGEVVSRDELIDLCWDGRTVGEDAINRCVQAIRRLATTHGGFAIQTVSRVGYRLIETAPAPDGPPVAVARGPSHRAPAEVPDAHGLGGPWNERRRLTVLSCHLGRPRRGASPVDPEEWRAIVQDRRRRVEATVAPLGGHLAGGTTDTLTIYFGYPRAREDAAERAVRAGLAILDELSPSASKSSDIGMAVRIGIDAGLVVIEQNERGLELFGDAPEVAARVQAFAAPNTVAVTGTVLDQVAGLFAVEALPRLPGDAAIPKPVFRVVKSVPHAWRGPGFGARELTPYVGRQDEIQLLSGCWARTCRGEGQLVLVRGEPGIGKTRLVREFRNRLEGAPHIWVTCGGERIHSDTPFQAVARMLGQLVGWRSDETPQARIAALERTLGGSGLDLEEFMPLVGELLGLPVSTRYPPLLLSPDQKRQRLFACLAAWVFNLVRGEPMVLVVEDLQWLDPSSMELLHLLVEQGATGPLMLLCTARSEFRAPWPIRAHHTQIILDKLSPAETRDLVMSLGAGMRLGRKLIDAVIARTDGVPLFAEELTRLMGESRGGGGKRDIPATLHDSLAARLARTGRAKDTAQLASVLGREFTYGLIAALSPLPPDRLRSDLVRLVEAELIQVRGVAPDAKYRFKHTLILDAAYEALLKTQRRELHARAAQMIGDKFPALAESQPELVARHWSESGEVERAVGAWSEAAKAALARHAYHEAERCNRQALAALDALPQTPERDTRELALLYRLAEVVGVVHGHASQAYLEPHLRAAGLAEKSGNLLQVVVQLLGQYVSAFTSGQHHRALVLADQMLDLARREGGDMSLRLAHMAQVTARHGSGDILGAEAHIEAWNGVVARSGYGQFIGETAAVHGASVEGAYLLGRADLARERATLAVAVAETRDSPFEVATALLTQAWLHVLLRDPEAAATVGAKALALAQEHGFTQVNQIRSTLAWAQARLGDPARAVIEAEDCLQGWLGGGFPRLAEARRLLAQVRALSGAPLEALEDLDLLCAAPAVNPTILAGHLICRAELRLGLGMSALAAADLRDAMALAKPRGIKAQELRAALLLAQHLRDGGDPVGARVLLAPIYDGFTEGLDTADLREANAFLAATGGPARSGHLGSE